MSAPGYSLKIPDIDPSETSDSSWVFSAADWLEYDAYLSSSNESYFDSLVDQLNLGRDREPENFGELDEELDDVTNKISAEINRRSIALNGAYPYSFIENGSGIKLKDSLSPGATSYIFSLIISHFTRSEILPGDLVPTDSQIINARNLFQICSTIAAAGECDGPGFSMGWPRDDKTFFLEKLQRIWEHYKDGIPVDTPPADAPESVKDCGVDTVSWWIEKDGRPGRGYLVGQAATGLNWEGKSADTARKFFALWFKEQPRSTAHIATFIPFIINEDEFRWLLRDHNHIINRTRLPARVDKGLTLSKNGIGPIERIEHIPEIENWLNTYKQSVVVPYNAP